MKMGRTEILQLPPMFMPIALDAVLAEAEVFAAVVAADVVMVGIAKSIVNAI